MIQYVNILKRQPRGMVGRMQLPYRGAVEMYCVARIITETTIYG